IEKRLRMFVLRAKVEIERLDQAVYGVLAAPSDEVPVLTIHEASQALWVKAPQTENITKQRWWVLGKLGEGDLPPLPTQQWQAQDIQAGLAWISAENQEQYLAQTLNLDLIGAISFTKGCYPGQEVIARSHYRGRIKRRCAWGIVKLESEAAPTPVELIGQDTFDAQQPKNPSGRVINAAQDGDQLHLLMEIR